MTISTLVNDYWPLLLIAAWFGYKWTSARRIRRLLPTLLQQGATLLDVRSVAEFAAASAPGTLNIPLPELRSRLHEIPQDGPLVVCCASGTRSAMAATVLRQSGHSKVYNAGTWRNLLSSPSTQPRELP